MTSASTLQWQSEVILDHTLMVHLAEVSALFQVIDEVLGFLQAQIPRFAHDLDRLDLLAFGHQQADSPLEIRCQLRVLYEQGSRDVSSSAASWGEYIPP